MRKGDDVVVAGDGQVSFGQTVLKSNARKVRTLSGGSVIAGFAGATADAFTLFERLEGKLEQHPGQLTRACVELAKDWRTDRYLRRLEAMMAVNKNTKKQMINFFILLSLLSTPKRVVSAAPGTEAKRSSHSLLSRDRFLQRPRLRRAPSDCVAVVRPQELG